jgi:type VI secretion system protein ImpL
VRLFRALRRFFGWLFGNWWLLTISCAVLLALLFAWGLPIFVEWMRPLWLRITFVVVIAAVWGFFVWLRLHRARQAENALAAELAGPNAADAEGRALAQRMAEALAKLRTAAGKQRNYLYTRPWYVIIGPPGAGKTTALLNSGLRFPFVEQAVGGVGGTRNLDFWFTDEAVLVDTAGRYTTQDSDQAVDAAGWTSFLKLLRRHRPLQPVNGILVAIGIDELVRGDCAKIDAHARAVRRRLVELRRTLEVAAPVYVVLTKADLLAGFGEYFDDLDVEGRRAVLGSTTTFADGRATAETLVRAFDEMAQAIADRQARRLFDEVDPRRRALMLGFPSQLRSLRARLMRFLEGAFTSGDEAAGVLRGFYLTSGLQEGAPLDRIMAGMAEVYDQPGQPGTAEGRGRAYFLNRLLGEVMFPEAGLVTTDPRAKARLRSQLIGAVAAIGIASLLVVTAWGVSFARNRNFQEAETKQAEAAEQQLRDAGFDMRQVRDNDADLRAALPALDTLRNLPQGYAVRRAGGPALTMRFGLFQSSLSREAEETYRDALRRILLPRLLLRLEAAMHASGNDPMQLYEPLKVYLMLGGQGPLDPRAVKAWVTTDWATTVYPGADSQDERAQLASHLDALLDDPDMSAAWPGRKAPLDGALVAQARAAIGTLSLADRAYAVMKQNAATAGPPWEAANILSQGDALAFADPKQALTAQIPYLFTREGYDKSYLIGLTTVQQDLKRDLWVLGGDAGTGGVQDEMTNVRPGVAGLYAKDYIAAWEGVLKQLAPGAYFHDPAAFGAFTKSPSPLKRFLLELRKNTVFKGGTQDQAGRLARYATNRSRFGRVAQDFNQGRVGGIDAGQEITDYFASLREYAGDGHGTAPVDDFVASVKAAGEAVMAAQSIGGGGGSDATQAQMATAMAAVKAAAAGAPPQLHDFAASAASGGSAAQVGAAHGAVADAYAQTVLPACQGVAQEHYPFFAAAPQDAAMVDVLRVFGMNGTLDGFVQTRLKSLIEIDGPMWHWNADDPVARTLNTTTPQALQKAADLRDMLAGGLPIKVKVDGFGTDVGVVEISSGGTRYRFSPTSNVTKPLLWSATGSLPEASVTLYKAAANQPKDGDPVPGAQLASFSAEGPWALFRVMDKADKQNAGAKAIKARFGQGGSSATLAIELPSDKNPFSRGGLWSFRCPNTL